ncbi:MAG: adenylate/guanylate cyclase domain-containing protein [Panacagrimonas sp.]
MPIDLAWNLIAIVALAMAVATSTLDWRSSTSHLLALMFGMLGIALVIEANFITGRAGEDLPAWADWATLPASLSMLATGEWLRRIRRTAAEPVEDRHSDRALTAAQLFIVMFGVVQFIWPEWRTEYLTHVLDDPSVLREWRFHLFAVPFGASIAGLYLVIIRTLALQPDAPERLRLVGLALALPLVILAFLTPSPISPYCAIIGQMVFLITLMQYHLQLGRRGQFMARFLSPQVAAAVRQHGMNLTIHEDRRELTAVSCDIRGFSAYAESQDSSQVLQLLERYYRLVGEIASQHGATIKDYAGDGMLLLVGAPLADPKHAAHAINLALDLRDRCEPLWQGKPLGLGIGMASGIVSLGIVGTQPMEYVAVGRAVNLASRLCDHADEGEILLSERSHELLPASSRDASHRHGEKVHFKGLAEATGFWRIAPGDDVPRISPPRHRSGRWWRKLRARLSGGD